MLRDRLRARMEEMGAAIDYVALAEEVLGIRNAPPALARTLVAEALVVGERREDWARAGQRICEAAPAAPGVYVLRDAGGGVLYVGKANNLKRRLQAHFAPKRWLRLDADMARVASAGWHLVGSELEALLVEAEWIQALAPAVNVQTGAPSMSARRIPSSLLHDLVLVLPASEPDLVTLVAARMAGATLIQRTRRDGTELARHVPRLWRFLVRLPARPSRLTGTALAPIVYSWLAGRGSSTTRLAARDLVSQEELHRRVSALLADRQLFSERLIVTRD